MKTSVLLFILFVLISFQNFAQYSDVKFGIKVAPIIHSTRILDDPSLISNDGSNTKLSLGLIVDKYFTDFYVLSSGLTFIPKEVRIDISSSAGNSSTVNATESYQLQYLQIPLTLKLFTNEVKPDVKIFFQLGMALEVKVHEEANPALIAPALITQFQPIDLPVILGTGLEYTVGLNTVVFAGISYHRGLTNSVKSVNVLLDQRPDIRSTILSLDLGVKF